MLQLFGLLLSGGQQAARIKEYWNKILAIDPANATAKRALDGIK